MRRKAGPAVPVVLLAFGLTAAWRSAAADQVNVARPMAIKKVTALQVTNYVLRLPDAYIVYEPSRDVFQIAALGAVLSYGDGWERRQIKPYLFHIRHQSWTNHFWKVNTSRREVYLVWGGHFGRIGLGSGPAREVEGDREDLRLEVVGGAGEEVPQRFFIRFAEADLYFDPAARDVRLAAAGTTLSPCADWEACELKDYLFHLRLNTWKGFFWKVNTSRRAAWQTTGGTFCQLGGQDKELALIIKSFQRPFSIVRLRTVLAAAEKARLQEIARMIEAGRPSAEISRASVAFIQEFPGVEPESALPEIAKNIKAAEQRMEEIKNRRQEATTAFENFDQKASQLFNTLSTILKNMKETQSSIIRNLL